MTVSAVLDSAGRRRSPATLAGFTQVALPQQGDALPRRSAATADV
jgi:hypothetical protein